jgi:hypothetical protein
MKREERVMQQSSAAMFFFFAKCHPHVTTWAVLIELAVDHKGLKETAGLLHKKVIEHQEDRLTSQQFGWTVS